MPVDEAFMKKNDDDEEGGEAKLGLEQKGEGQGSGSRIQRFDFIYHFHLSSTFHS